MIGVIKLKKYRAMKGRYGVGSNLPFGVATVAEATAALDKKARELVDKAKNGATKAAPSGNSSSGTSSSTASATGTTGMR